MTTAISDRRFGRRACFRRTLFALLSVLFCLPGFTRAGDDLLAFWGKRAAAGSDHGAALEVCRDYQKRLAGDEYGPVVDSVAAWHELAAGKTNAARSRLARLLDAGQGPVMAEAAENARRWLTRLDREEVESALKDFYAANIKFPDSLRAFGPARGRFSLTDRWGRPWSYRLAAFKHFRLPADQRYTLESSTLGATSDLGAALKIQGAAGMALKSTGFVTVDRGKSVAEFEPASGVGRRFTMMEGTTQGGVKCVSVAPHFILLSDGDRWAVVPRPTAGGRGP